MVYSQPFKGKVDREELKKHLYFSEENKEAYPYEYSFYEKKWGVCLPHNKIFDKDGKDKLKKGEYEVNIDVEFKPGTMKVATHTIPGKTDREIILLAHLDHPHQANDNLSGVACLIDLVKKIKPKDKEHTIKLVFCPETIGSIAYVSTKDISKVDFVVAVDICGNDNGVLYQRTFEEEHRLNRLVDLAVKESITEDNTEEYRFGEWRHMIGSDEYPFTDPQVGIPGLLLTRYPYHEYHTSFDTPDKINVKKIEHVQKIIMNLIKIYEKDYIPSRVGRLPVHRTTYGVQVPFHVVNRTLDYLLFNVDGEKYLSDIVYGLNLNYEFCYDYFEKLKKDGLIIDKKLLP